MSLVITQLPKKIPLGASFSCSIDFVKAIIITFLQVVGVAQIINKIPGPVPFTQEDEEVTTRRVLNEVFVAP